MNAAKRIQKEQDKMLEDRIPGIQAAPRGGDLFHWGASVAGPEGSPYEGGTFELDIRLPPRYPLEPPHIKFRTPIFHPNVNRGEICLDILKTQWSPALSLQKVLLSISSLLTDPNFADPLDAAAAALFQKNRTEYDARCRDMTHRFAMSGSSSASGQGGGTKRKAPEPAAPADAPGAAAAKSKAKAKARTAGSPSTVASKAAAKAKAKARGRAGRSGPGSD